MSTEYETAKRIGTDEVIVYKNEQDADATRDGKVYHSREKLQKWEQAVLDGEPIKAKLELEERTQKLGDQLLRCVNLLDARTVELEESNKIRFALRGHINDCTGIPAAYGFCEPVEGYLAKPEMLAKAMHDMGKAAREMMQSRIEAEQTIASLKAELVECGNNLLAQSHLIQEYSKALTWYADGRRYHIDLHAEKFDYSKIALGDAYRDSGRVARDALAIEVSTPQPNEGDEADKKIIQYSQCRKSQENAARLAELDYAIPEARKAADSYASGRVKQVMDILIDAAESIRHGLRNGA